MNKDSIYQENEVSGIVDDIFVADLIISGGQRGADLGGLRGACACGIATGGFAPRGWRTEAGPMPHLSDYGLLEAPTDDYAERTRLNVELCDAIILVANKMDSPGSRLTHDLALRYGKAYFQVPYGPLRKLDSADTVPDIRLWLAYIRPGVLMIAGNRESVAKGIERWTEELVKKIFA